MREPEFITDLIIADIPIRLKTETELPVEPACAPFLAKEIEPRYMAEFRLTDHLEPHSEQILHRENCYRVYPDERYGYLRGFFNVGTDDRDYALGKYRYAEGTIEIDYLDSGTKFVNELSNSFFHIGLEALLIQEQKICLHASLIDTEFGGILFSGPSGIGKSTQAELWCRAGEARLINGDRPILGMTDGRWYGWGSPYAGSSRCYVNEKVPIAAVVLLDQAPDCTLERLPLGAAFRSIYRELTVNQWNSDFVLEAMELAGKLAGAVPVCHFSCTRGPEAQQFLKQYLTGDLIHP